MNVNATPATLGKYPVCEPSAVVKVTCPELGENCLLVGDNEQKEALFLYPLNSKGLESSNQIELALDKEISDIEAISKRSARRGANLDNNKILIFGSYSRNSKCKIKNKRRRFLQAELSGNQLKPISKLVKYPEKDVKLQSKILFNGLNINNNKILSAVSKAIDQAENKANMARKLGTEDENTKECKTSAQFIQFTLPN